MLRIKHLMVGLGVVGLCILPDTWQALAASSAAPEPPLVECPTRFRVVSDIYQGTLIAKLIAGDVYLFTTADGIRTSVRPSTCAQPCALIIDPAGPGLLWQSGVLWADFIDFDPQHLLGSCIEVNQTIRPLLSSDTCVEEGPLLQIIAVQDVRFNAARNRFAVEIEMRQILAR